MDTYNRSSKRAVLRRLLEPKQYTSIAFGQRCRKAGISLSMGSTGDCFDCETVVATRAA